LNKGQQVGIELISMGIGKTMGRIGVDLQDRVFDELR